MCGHQLEYWVGGGPPPPYYRSDQIRLIDGASGPKWIFSRPYVDNTFEPPDLVEKFERQASAVDIRKVVALLVQANTFSSLEVVGQHILGSDALATEIIVSFGGVDHMRKFQGALPDTLLTLDAEVHVLRMDLELNGARSVTHSGKPVIPAPPRPK
jgi:hypothetical protein